MRTPRLRNLPATGEYAGSTHEERFAIIRDVIATLNPLMQRRRFNAAWDTMLILIENKEVGNG